MVRLLEVCWDCSSAATEPAMSVEGRYIHDMDCVEKYTIVFNYRDESLLQTSMHGRETCSDYHQEL